MFNILSLIFTGYLVFCAYIQTVDMVKMIYNKVSLAEISVWGKAIAVIFVIITLICGFIIIGMIFSLMVYVTKDMISSF